MLMMKNELISASVMSTIVAILVWWNSPKQENKEKTFGIIIKAFIIAFIVCFSIFYFISDSGTDEAIENMIKGPPDF